jgi:STE24 endopeptidase
VIEEKYGFNKMTPGTFVSDELKKFAIVAVLTAVVIPLILWVVANSGPALVFTLAGTSIALVLIISLLVPTVIVPLFFTYADLEEGDLKKAILEEAARTDVKVAEIKVIDGSKRSSHSNAFVSGFWNFRKVVLFDTLIAQQPIDEVRAVVNHELGHVVHNHVLKHAFC